jgi:hypothetical protein
MRLTIGADPEYELVNWAHGGLVTYHTYAECSHGQRGCDGCSAIGEVRPNATEHPRELVDRTYALLAEAARADDGYVSVTGHLQAIGCHIHVGGVPFSVITCPWVEQIMNVYAGIVYGLSGSARGNYAYPYAYETKHYGLEFRGFPAAIMHDRRLFESVVEGLLARVRASIEGALDDSDRWFDDAAYSLVYKRMQRTKLNGRIIRLLGPNGIVYPFGPNVEFPEGIIADLIRVANAAAGEVIFFRFRAARGWASTIPAIGRFPYGWNYPQYMRDASDILWVGLPHGCGLRWDEILPRLAALADTAQYRLQLKIQKSRMGESENV